MLEYISLPNTWASYIEQISHMIVSLQEVLKWEESNKTILENIVHLCKDLIEGVSYNDQFDNNILKVWYLSTEYESKIRTHLTVASEKLKKLDPSYVAPNPRVKMPESSCFVVTATMGDSQHPKVILMREFRDKWIIQRKFGESLVKFYYKAGPAVASLVSSGIVLRRLSYFFIVVPACWIAQKLLKLSRAG